MKKSSLKIAVKYRKLSVPEMIKRSRHIVDQMISNAPLFPNPDPSLPVVSNSINDLEVAWNDTEDGGKTKFKIMRSRKDELMKHIYDLANYVQKTANGDESIVFAAGFDTRKNSLRDVEDFSVEHGGDKGSVYLRVRPRTEKKTFYRWEFCENPLNDLGWEIAKTTSIASAHYGDLKEAVKYWFRVIYVDADGETQPFDPKSIVVI